MFGGDNTETSGSAVAVDGPWKLPDDVRAAGAQVDLHYDGPPNWTGTSGCGGGLKEGARRLGNTLRSKFSAISSIGGYACRRNTANSSQMSVHGTGRALDVFIPTSGGAADNGKGDPVANWLVMNATRIGVQLVIWDRSIWHCDGRNETRYGGPVPHIDHIHVELTLDASAMKTPFFQDEETTDPGTPDETDSSDPETDTSEGDGEDDAGTSSGGSSGTTSSSGSTSSSSGSTSSSSGSTSSSSGSTSSSSGSTSSSSGSTSSSSGSTSSSSGSTSSGSSSSGSSSGTATPPAEEPEASTSSSGSAPQEGSVETEGDDDGPGERNSLGGSTSTKTTKKGGSARVADYTAPAAGCSVSSPAMPASGSPFLTLAVSAIALAAARRRRAR